MRNTNPTIELLQEGARLGPRRAVDLEGFAITDNPSSGVTQVRSVPGLLVLERDTNEVVIQTDVETNILDYTAPANTLDVDGRRLIFEGRGDIFNNGLTRNSILRIYFGGALAWSAPGLQLTSVNVRRPYWLRVECIRTSETLCDIHGRLELGPANATLPSPGTGGNFAVSGTLYNFFSVDVPAIAANALPFRVSWQQSFAGANMETRQQAAFVFTE